MANQEEKVKSEAPPSRGPSYPFIDLQEAVVRIRKFYDQEGKAPAAVSTAVTHWGYSEKSSGGRQTVSTLLQFGLVREDGASQSRRIWLSKLALDILLLEPDSQAHKDALKVAAKSPKLYAELLNHYAATGLPSDGSLKHFLLTERDIAKASVDSVIKHFRSTIRYANLLGSDTIQADTADKNDLKPPKEPQIGDFVQWSPGGVDQFDPPRRVRAVDEQDGDKWVFVEGSDTGLPIAETTVEQVATPIKTPPIKPLTMLEIKEPGESEWLKGRISKDGKTFRLIGTGDFGPKEIKSLIKLLETQQAILDEE